MSDRALQEGLYPRGDPQLRKASPDTVASLSLDAVRSYYRRTFRPDLTTLVVIGQVTPERARAVVEDCFGAWRAEGPRPETTLPSVPLNKPVATRIVDEDADQSGVTLAETLGITRTHPDYCALQMGCHVLSGGFYATRLYRDLREEAGLVYSVEADLDATRTRSLFQLDYNCDAANERKARAIVVHDLREMQTSLVSPAELQQARAILLRGMLLARSNVGDIVGGMLNLTDDDLPLDEPTRVAERYVQTTAEQVKVAFAQWIRPDDLVEVTVGPTSPTVSSKAAALFLRSQHRSSDPLRRTATR